MTADVILDACDLGLVLIDSAGLVAGWNAWMERGAEIARADALGQPFLDICGQSADTRLAQAVDDALRRGLSSLVTSALNEVLLPIGALGREGVRQSIQVKPVATAAGRACLLQVADIDHATHREALLLQQARTMRAQAESHRMSELHIRAVFDNTVDAILTFDDGGMISGYNPATEVVFGYGTYEIVPVVIDELIGDLAPPPGGTHATVAETYRGHRRTVTGRRRDGTTFPLELSVGRMDSGGRTLYIAIAHDITERLRREEELHTQKTWLSNLIDAVPDLICVKDAEGRWLVANQFYLDLFQLNGVAYEGKSAEELAASTPIYGPYLLQSRATDQQAWDEGRTIVYDHQVALPDGSTKSFDVRKIPLFNGDGSRKGLVVVGRDVTDSREAALRLEHLAHYDTLTGLPNRALFRDRLHQALAHARRGGTLLGLIFLDLDKFKDINDTVGQRVGDLLLKAVAKRLQRCVRETDTVARLSGDEFAVLLTELDSADGAGTVADAIIHSVSHPYGIEDREISSTISAGITVFPHDGDDADLLLRNADLALFRSKSEGRNTYHFYVAEMDQEVQARKAIEQDLRLAVAGNHLALHYQPLVDLVTGRVTGTEALLRWFHPERGYISPDVFIPIAERTDLILPLGRWVIFQACAQVREWLDRGLPPVRVAVNLSPTQFRDQDMIQTVRDALDRTQLDPNLLQLEITEGVAMHDIAATTGVLQQLRALGLTIAIDDFGTGYSSLNYLKRFPADKLKIDKSFVTDIGLHPDNAAIVRAIINLGHSIGTKVNVEGVETLEQLRFVRAHGVDEGQGFYFSKALAPDAFARLIAGPPPWRFED